ncbi:protein adenylyltransferase SelO [Geitlerinema calcuttense]|uniref:Protein nucleotidyltransferase YdiU n=1 Tax=Geitlerinema calcuttense NRMC-F 0142 TaxID=2922238 RepID=A0ABT7LYI4_9CYAN|nr:YdiU family protein [Geitlerinema calcuttense]MDL5057070.1 YdiU family protein [Geitlerinema calcuttense NRMC-F 0142]
MTPNPFIDLNYEPALEELGEDYYDLVAPAEFPQHILRWRNDPLLLKIGLDPKSVTDEHFIQTFGKFEVPRSFLALRYHGYQFGEYNPHLGDGRGFLFGQVRGVDGELYDFGTKGSGRTPYSRTADGRLTLKGGVREVLAAEALHQLGVKTSRCLSVVETGEQLWRGDEPSPTRSCVMVRFSRSHIRFGTFERLYYFQRSDLIKKLLDHAIAVYYPTLASPLAAQSKKGSDCTELYAQFYAELVLRVAELAAQWMTAGFCHAVLNTDNMSITGESFDYGPYAFIPNYNPQFTAAYFDYYGRYSYGNQPEICRLNLEMLQIPLKLVVPQQELETGLAQYDSHYFQTYQQLMMRKLGLEGVPPAVAEALLEQTIYLLKDTQLGYHEFFIRLSEVFDASWREDATQIPNWANAGPSTTWENWRNLYYRQLQSYSPEELSQVATRLRQHNPKTVLLRPVIESVWEAITTEDNWEPFYQLVRELQQSPV